MRTKKKKKKNIQQHTSAGLFAYGLLHEQEAFGANYREMLRNMYEYDEWLSDACASIRDDVSFNAPDPLG